MARAPKIFCASCESRIAFGVPFCSSCGQPTEWATHDERIQWEVSQWRGTRGGTAVATAPAAVHTPTVVTRRERKPVEVPRHEPVVSVHALRLQQQRAAMPEPPSAGPATSGPATPATAVPHAAPAEPRHGLIRGLFARLFGRRAHTAEDAERHQTKEAPARSVSLDPVDTNGSAKKRSEPAPVVREAAPPSKPTTPPTATPRPVTTQAAPRPAARPTAQKPSTSSASAGRVAETPSARPVEIKSLSLDAGEQSPSKAGPSAEPSAPSKSAKKAPAKRASATKPARKTSTARAKKPAAKKAPAKKKAAAPRPTSAALMKESLELLKHMSGRLEALEGKIDHIERTLDTTDLPEA